MPGGRLPTTKDPTPEIDEHSVELKVLAPEPMAGGVGPLAEQLAYVGGGARPTAFIGILNQWDTFFRTRAAQLRNGIAHAVQVEEAFWAQLVESAPSALGRLEDYARAAGGARPAAKAAEFASDADPWSAAFVAYIMQQAGVQPSEFRFALGHDEYIKAARDNRQAGHRFLHFWLCAPNEVAPEIGDILCTNRGGGTITYDPSVSGGGLPRDFISHGDVVTGRSTNASGADVLVTVGGNLRNGLRRRLVPIDANFRVTATSHRRVEPARLRPGRYFAVVRIRSSLFETYP